MEKLKEVPHFKENAPGKGKVWVCPVTSEKSIWGIAGLCKKTIRLWPSAHRIIFLSSLLTSLNQSETVLSHGSPCIRCFYIAQRILKLLSSKHNGSMTSASVNALFAFFPTCYFPSGYLSSALCLPNELKVQGEGINLSKTTERQPWTTDVAGEKRER